MSKSCGRDIQERARLLLEALLKYEPSRDRESFERLLKADLESSLKPQRGYDKNQKLAFNIYELNDRTGRVIDASLYSLAKLTKFTGSKELTEQQVNGVIYCLSPKAFGIIEQSSGQGATIRKLILRYENILNRFDDACQRWNTNKSKFHKSKPPKSNVNFTCTNNIPSNIPYSTVSRDGFVGRDNELERVDELLQQNNQVAITAIAGMGGVGKTELAVQYCLAHQTAYSGGICWLYPPRAETFGLQEDIGVQLVRFARSVLRLNLPENLDLLGQVRFCWGSWQPAGDVLLVLDDVTDYKPVQCYLESKPSRFKVLMTTRERLQKPFVRLDLDVLKPLAAMNILKSLVGRERLEQEPWVARRLCKWLGYLPLGLELVGRYLAEIEDWSLAEMLQRLEQKRLRDKSLNQPRAEMRTDRGVAAAFELSWERLDKNAQQLGCLLSLFALAPIPWSLVESVGIGQDSDDLRDARATLVRFNLLKAKDKVTFQLHPLVREFLCEKLQESPLADEFKRKFAATVVKVAKQVPQLPTNSSIAVVTPAIPHIAEVATALTDFLNDEDLVEPYIFVSLARFYKAKGFYDQAKPWFKHCLSVTETRLGSDHPTVAMSLNNLAGLYITQGRYDKAEPPLKSALKIYRHLPGGEHPDLGLVLKNLALLHQYQGRYNDAKSFYKQAVEHWQHTLGNYHPYIMTALSDWASLYRDQGDYNEAIRLLTHAMEICHCSTEVSPLEVANILNHLGLLYFNQGCRLSIEPSCMKKAELLYMTALDIKVHLLGDDHLSVAVILNNIAGLYHAQGFHIEAESWFIRVLEILEQRLGLEHPQSVMCRNNLAIVRAALAADG